MKDAGLSTKRAEPPESPSGSWSPARSSGRAHRQAVRYQVLGESFHGIAGDDPHRSGMPLAAEEGMRLRDVSAAIWSRRSYLWLAIAVMVGVAAIRIALPFIVKDYVNRRLHSLHGYDGRVADIDLGLWRGAYRIDGIEIVKTGAKVPTPFFKGDRVDFSVEWHSLLHGKLVSEAHFYRPVLNLVEDPKDEKHSQLGKEEDWHARLEELFPFRFNTVEVHDGTVTFRTPGIDTKDALTARELNGIITNITNVVKTKKDKVFKNQPKDQVAAKIPFSGTLNGANTQILPTIASVLRNAFVHAFTHSIDSSISLDDVEDTNAG
jgi:hypothetical protein